MLLVADFITIQDAEVEDLFPQGFIARYVRTPNALAAVKSLVRWWLKAGLVRAGGTGGRGFSEVACLGGERLGRKQLDTAS